MWPKYNPLPSPKPRAKLNTRNSIHEFKGKQHDRSTGEFQGNTNDKPPLIGNMRSLNIPNKKNKKDKNKSSLISVHGGQGLRWLSYSNKKPSPHCTLYSVHVQASMIQKKTNEYLHIPYNVHTCRIFQYWHRQLYPYFLCLQKMHHAAFFWDTKGRLIYF